MTKEESEVIPIIRAILVPFGSKFPLDIRQLQRTYFEMEGCELPFKDFGYRSCKEMLENHPTEFQLIDSGDKIRVKYFPKKGMEHVSNLVAKNKSQIHKFPNRTFYKNHSLYQKNNFNSKFNNNNNFNGTAKSNAIGNKKYYKRVSPEPQSSNNKNNNYIKPLLSESEMTDIRNAASSHRYAPYKTTADSTNYENRRNNYYSETYQDRRSRSRSPFYNRKRSQRTPSPPDSFKTYSSESSFPYSYETNQYQSQYSTHNDGYYRSSSTDSFEFQNKSYSYGSPYRYRNPSPDSSYQNSYRRSPSPYRERIRSPYSPNRYYGRNPSPDNYKYERSSRRSRSRELSPHHLSRSYNRSPRRYHSSSRRNKSKRTPSPRKYPDRYITRARSPRKRSKEKYKRSERSPSTPKRKSSSKKDAKRSEKSPSTPKRRKDSRWDEKPLSKSKNSEISNEEKTKSAEKTSKNVGSYKKTVKFAENISSSSTEQHFFVPTFSEISGVDSNHKPDKADSAKTDFAAGDCVNDSGKQSEKPRKIINYQTEEVSSTTPNPQKKDFENPHFTGESQKNYEFSGSKKNSDPTTFNIPVITSSRFARKGEFVPNMAINTNYQRQATHQQQIAKEDTLRISNALWNLPYYKLDISGYHHQNDVWISEDQNLSNNNILDNVQNSQTQNGILEDHYEKIRKRRFSVFELPSTSQNLSRSEERLNVSVLNRQNIINQQSQKKIESLDLKPLENVFKMPVTISEFSRQRKINENTPTIIEPTKANPKVSSVNNTLIKKPRISPNDPRLASKIESPLKRVQMNLSHDLALAKFTSPPVGKTTAPIKLRRYSVQTTPKAFVNSPAQRDIPSPAQFEILPQVQRKLNSSHNLSDYSFKPPTVIVNFAKEVKTENDVSQPQTQSRMQDKKSDVSKFKNIFGSKSKENVILQYDLRKALTPLKFPGKKIPKDKANAENNVESAPPTSQKEPKRSRCAKRAISLCYIAAKTPKAERAARSTRKMSTENLKKTADEQQLPTLKKEEKPLEKESKHNAHLRHILDPKQKLDIKMKVRAFGLCLFPFQIQVINILFHE